MGTSKRLVFFGTENFSLPSLQALVEGGFNVVAVVTKPDSVRGRSGKLVSPAVKIYAESQNIPVYQPQKLADIHDDLIALNPDAGVLVSYGKILPQRTLDVFEPIGIINLHPSALPRYRGPAPIEAALLNGDKEVGISIMKLTYEMDAGPVFVQTTQPLAGNETKPELYDRLAQDGATLLYETLPDILENQIEPKEQKENDVSYTSLLRKQDGILDPTTDAAHVLERKVRAYLTYPKTRLTLHDVDVIVTSVFVTESSSSAPLVISCANDTYLAVRELIAPSGKTMSGEAFKRGYLD